jgi:SAM-dependent methyltransferase
VNASDTPCPVCASAETTAFYSLADAPVTCTSVFPDPRSARAVPRGDVLLRCCVRCGFIYNGGFELALAEVGARYESSQASSAHFGSFARSLAKDWIDRYSLRGKTVLEIGCGHGEFLAELVRGGIGRGIGYDPLADPTRLTVEGNRVQLFPEPFDKQHVAVAADAIVCRHTLEHIYDISRFLRLVRSWAEQRPGSVVLFEVPAAERVLAEYAFWDVYYEHCGYFTRATLEHAFRLAGFRVLRTALVYDEQYLILEATAARDAERTESTGHAEAVLSACRLFGECSRRSIDRCRSALESLAADGLPPVIWQGAAKTVGFLSALGDDRLVDCAIDLSLHRQGRFLPPSGLPVYAPEKLVTLRPRHVVLMNPVYHREVGASLRSLGLDTTLLTVNQLCEGPRTLEAGCA